MSGYIPVLHSVSYAGAWPGQCRLSVEDFLTKAQQLGYSHVALVGKEPHVSPLRCRGSRRQELRRRLEDEGLHLAAIMGYTDFTCGLQRPGIPSAEMNAAYVDALCELCAELNCRLLRVFTGYRVDGVSYDSQYQEVVRGLQLAGDRAKEHGVTLIVQNHHDVAAHHKEFHWLLNEVSHPNVRAAFDCWACWLQGVRGDDLRSAVAGMAEFLQFTTVADYHVLPRYIYRPEMVNYQRQEPALVRATTPGQGELDYSSFFAGLADIGYQGPVAYEMCAPLEGGGSEENLDRTAIAFREFLDGFNVTRQ